MRILFEICHPAHVHYFKNVIKLLQKEGNEVLVLAQNRGIILELLDTYKIDYIVFKNSPKGLIKKVFYIFKIDAFFFKYVKTFKPDLLVGFSGAYVSHMSFLFRKKSIIFDDTEHATFQRWAYKPFATTILTPNCYKKDLGKKHIRFKGYMELFYLHPTFFKRESLSKTELQVHPKKKNVLIRFVFWRASHDVGQNGFNLAEKIKLIKNLSVNYNIIISSEEDLPKELEKYQYKIKPSLMHQLMCSVDLFIGEGATMASECAILGTPFIYVNSLKLCYVEEQINVYGSGIEFSNGQGVLEKAKEILSQENFIPLENKNKIINENIDVTTFLFWFLKDYPKSKEIMHSNPAYQNRFIINSQ